MSGRVRVAIVPHTVDAVADAVTTAGGVVVDPSDADAIVWTEPSDPEALREVLERSSARWVQLPFAGIERFVGVIDPSRTWTCAKGIYGEATAELAVALVLAASRRLHAHARATTWTGGEHAGVHRRLRGTEALVIGAGGIGRSVARMLGAFGVRVVVASRSGAPVEDAASSHRVDDLPDLVPNADWIVIAAAHTPNTHRMVEGAFLARMKRDAWIVNVARGGLVDTAALVEALRAERIGGAMLDVTDPEPLPDDHPLWAMPNVLITSHTANTWAMALPELASLVERNVARFARGDELEGLVDPSLGY